MVIGFIVFFIFCILGHWWISSFESNMKERNTYANNSKLSGFDYGVTKKIAKHTFLFSPNYKEMAIRCDGRTFGNTPPRVINIESLISCEISQNNSVVKKHGIGRAVVGGVLAGGVGAIVGANTASTQDKIKTIDLKFLTNDINNAMITVQVFDVTLDGVDYSSSVMRECDELVATINLILNQKTA